MRVPKFYTVLSIAALSLVKLADAHDTSLASVKRAFQDAHIPEDLRLTFEPKIHLNVTYFLDDGNTFDVYPGAPLARHGSIRFSSNLSTANILMKLLIIHLITETAHPPVYHISECHVSAGPFVVAMIDPGAQTNPNITQVRHFLGGDYYYNELNGVFYNRTPAVTEYKQPSPPSNSDPHRYTWLLFNQSPKFSRQTLVDSTTNRLYFDIAKFAQETELGDPIAGNFVLVGPEVLPGA
ncbi:hypothetical protein NLJ89_g7424 [Agrocybe chaxingu]|uniref:PEBP-like protein n=1 Tax=Agrocybe chaxingu TaxID=84603 RepID=A0A9W8JZ70_9AGAR|nr:hypothetical protein NLJ89_g7424 [Agrocybe chaxingu]